MLERSHALEDGARVRLRLARSRDLPAIARLLRAAGSGDELEATRLARFDPRRQAVIAAGCLQDGVERLVAIGAIDLVAEAPTLIVTEPGQDPGLARLMADALVCRARAHSAHRAA